MFTKPITISLSPNTQRDDVMLALKTILRPWMWKTGAHEEKVKAWLANFFQNSQVLLYNSGRSAEYELLKAFGVGNGDEVIIQAFTCVAVPNSILWVGAKPIFCDIDKELNISAEKLKQRITKNTKAIIVQHTFGVPAEIDKIVEIGNKNNILVIEDCAHALGATYKGKLLGTWGDAAFFSFGRDKVVSSVFGGSAVISKKHADVFLNMQKRHESLSYPSLFWIFQQVFHPIAFSIILPLYMSGIGKVLLFILQKLHMLSFPVYPEEKRGKNPGLFPQKYPNALASLGLLQLQKLEMFNAIRRKIVKIYSHNNIRDGAIYLRYAMFVKSRDDLLKKFKQNGVLLGNWYQSPVDPRGVDANVVNYINGSCPVAEEKGASVINLPTLISESDAHKIVKMIQLEQ